MINNNIANAWIVAPQPQTPIVNAIQPIPVKSTYGEAFKPKRAGKNTSHVIFLLDDSGSMQSCRDTTISGYNEYLDSQKADAEKTGIKTFVSLYKFDGYNVNCVFDRKPVDEANHISRDDYNPQGMTNLYDGMGGVMMAVNKNLEANKKADRDSVIVTVLTDGGENSSKTFNNLDIKQMVEKCEGKNWGFMFLGANIDAFAVGSRLGFNVNNTIQYDTNNMGSTIRAASAMTTRMKSAYASGMATDDTYASTAFTFAERSSAIGEENE